MKSLFELLLYQQITFIMNLSLRYLHIVCALILISLFQSCKPDPVSTFNQAKDFDSKTIVTWNEQYLDLDKVAGGYRPGASARTAGLLNYAVYETVVPGMPSYKSLGNLYPELTLPTADASLEYNWPIAASCAYKYMLERLFYKVAQTNIAVYSDIQGTYNAEMTRLSSGVPADVIQRSKTWGEDVARSVYNWSKTDAFGHDTPQIDPSYVPPVFAGSWQPTFPDFTKAFFPYWGKVRTFAAFNKTLVSLPPIPYSTQPGSAYYQEGLEVYNTVNDIKANAPGSYDDKWIAEFWSDDITNLTFSPPARLIAIADQMVVTENFDLEKAVAFYAQLGATINDVSVAVWKNKYDYNVERPIQYIRNVISAQYPDAANWTTILNNIPAGVNGVTPPFPAYPSGHSGFGGGGEVIYSAFFGVGGDYVMTDNCHADRTEFIGTPRTYTSFRQMGEENAFSRVPLGVHFRMDCVEGLRLGREVAQNVLVMPWK
jgi:hypothetical protein